MKKIIAVTLLALSVFAVDACASVVPAADWQFDQQTNRAYVQSENAIGGKHAILYLGNLSTGEKGYVFYSGNQPRNCMGQPSGKKFASTDSHGILSGWKMCAEQPEYDKHYISYLAFDGESAKKINDSLLSGKVTINDYVFNNTNHVAVTAAVK
jgi:hypothetical protein